MYTDTKLHPAFVTVQRTNKSQHTKTANHFFGPAFIYFEQQESPFTNEQEQRSFLYVYITVLTFNAYNNPTAHKKMSNN